MNERSAMAEVLKELGSAVGPTSESLTLPPVLFTSADIYECEKHAIFEREWLCVGREAWVPNKGDYFTTNYVDEPLIVVRTQTGEIKCLSAVCQHRGMLVAEGSGNCRFFKCPYHSWVYSLDGGLAGAPAMDKTPGFDRTGIALPSLLTETWHGFIFVNFDPNAELLGPRLKKWEQDVEHFDLASAAEPQHDRFSKLPWNWKVMFENTNDGYHANRLHKGPLHDIAPSHLVSWGEWDESDVAYVRYTQMTHMDGSFNPTLNVLLSVFPKLTEQERQRMTIVNIPPTFWLALTPDQAFYFCIHPDGPKQVWIDQGRLYTPSALADPLFSDKVDIYSHSQQHMNDQDRYVDTLQQRGLASRFANRSRLSWQEESQARFARWLVKRYRQSVGA